MKSPIVLKPAAQGQPILGSNGPKKLAGRSDFMFMAGHHNILRNDYYPSPLVPKLIPHVSMPMTSKTEGKPGRVGKIDVRPDHLRARQGRT